MKTIFFFFFLFPSTSTRGKIDVEFEKKKKNISLRDMKIQNAPGEVESFYLALYAWIMRIKLRKSKQYCGF